MSRIFHQNKCTCNKDFTLIKKHQTSVRSEGKPLQYPKSKEVMSKIFRIKYPSRLPLTIKVFLNSFQNKYIYYAIDDLIYNSNSSSKERDLTLSILYSPIISIQNNFSVNFFDIWIGQIYIDEKIKLNKFINKKSSLKDKFTYITIQFFYKTRVQSKTPGSFW